MFTLGLDTSDIGAFRLSEATENPFCALFWSTFFTYSTLGLSICKSEFGLHPKTPSSQIELTPLEQGPLSRAASPTRTCQLNFIYSVLRGSLSFLDCQKSDGNVRERWSSENGFIAEATAVAIRANTPIPKAETN